MQMVVRFRKLFKILVLIKPGQRESSCFIIFVSNKPLLKSAVQQEFFMQWQKMRKTVLSKYVGIPGLSTEDKKLLRQTTDLSERRGSLKNYIL